VVTGALTRQSWLRKCYFCSKKRDKVTFPQTDKYWNMRNLVIALGATIFAAGAVLWCGNVFGFFVTFPFAGYLTLLVGGFTFRAGKKMSS